jgi:hypothetical protein
MTPEQLAGLFHETYERLAPQFGYETRKETAVSWDDIPADNPNKRLMIAVCGEVLPAVLSRPIPSARLVTMVNQLVVEAQVRQLMDEAVSKAIDEMVQKAASDLGDLA